MEDREQIYRRWLDAYDRGRPDEALDLAAPEFVMVTPEGKRLDLAAAREFTGQMKAYIESMGLARKTTVDAIVAVPLPGGLTTVTGHVTLTLTPSSGAPIPLKFMEILTIGPQGILMDAFARLSESQGLG